MTHVSPPRRGTTSAVEPERRTPARSDRPSSTPPRVGAGEALRLRGDGSLSVLWPTHDAVDYPFVGVVSDGAGHRYPLYLDAEAAAERCAGGFCVVEASSIPIESPPHARLDR